MQPEDGMAGLIALLPPSVRQRVAAMTTEGLLSEEEPRSDDVGSNRGPAVPTSSVSREGDGVAAALRTGKNIYVSSEWLPRERLLPAHMQAVSMLEEQGREARMGGDSDEVPNTGTGTSGASKWEDAKVRGDRIMWLSAGEDDESDTATSTSTEAAPLSGPLRRVIEAIKGLRTQLLHDGLNVGGRVSCQLAGYPGNGTRYVRHCDRSDSVPLRRVTAIVYLNPEWDTQVDGGQLVVYKGTAAANEVEDATMVPPCGGRLVVFDSRLPHEVLPAFAARYALTTWFSCDPSLSAHDLLFPSPQPRDAAADNYCVAAASVDGAESRVERQQRHYPTCTGACLCPPPPTSPSLSGERGAGDSSREEGSDAIFVSLVSFCDPETAFTVLSLFEAAREPERIRVGIVWQARAEDVTAHMRPLDGSPWRRHVREMRFDWREASGPCRARHLAASLWAGEPFLLQIDSHMRFARGWDAALLSDLRRAEEAVGHRKAVLSTYPPDYDGHGRDARVPTDSRPTLLCASHFNPKDGLLRIRLAGPCEGGPLPSLFWAAGFSFSRSRLLKEVPYDPHLPLLFFGEELLQLARMWTRGWRVFAPTNSVVFHLWSRDNRETFAAKVPQDPDTKRASQRRVRELLTGRAPPPTAAAYGLGGKGWAEFGRHCGVDFEGGGIEGWALLGGEGREEGEFAQ